MSVHFLSAELSKWDEASGEALVLTVFTDERPLRGAAGLADWRLCGRLSRLIKHKHLAGKGQEVLMMPPGRRLPFPRLVIFGLGKSDDFSEEKFRHQVRRIRVTMHKAGVTNYALQPPGRATGLIAARRALEIWMEESEKHDDIKETVAIVDTPGAQKEMADILHAYHRRAQS
jgi:hypothetical protein